MTQATVEHAPARLGQILAALIARLRSGLDDRRRREREEVLAQYRLLLEGDPHLLADVGLTRAEVLRAMSGLRTF